MCFVPFLGLSSFVKLRYWVEFIDFKGSVLKCDIVLKRILDKIGDRKMGGFSTSRFKGGTYNSTPTC